MQSFKKSILGATAGAALAVTAFGATPALALVTPGTTTPAAVVDTANTRPYWVGLMIRNEAGNGGGTCTGLLINPRTVLFAAHCVDGVTPAGYDGNSPGNRAQVGYTTDPTFGRTNLREWLFGQDFAVPAGDARVANASSVMVWYDPRSRNGSAWDPNQGTFLPADVAIAGFDTPTELLGRDAQNGIGLLFSRVNGLVPVTIGGFGQAGNGLDGTRLGGTLEETFFRRLGQNMLGYLGDERSIALGIYPAATADGLEPPGFNYQDLYWVDFDDPQRSSRPFFNGPGGDPLCATFPSNANCRLDHDPFPGAAVAGEAITAAGDSGSPLVTSAFGREVSLGVLSQGSRFFYESIGNPDDNFVRFTGFSNYGTTAGWNPLFLFWDQIVVNNPYKYVTAVAGDGEWTNAARWTQEIDPLYFTLSGSTLVNALPTTPALGSSGAAPNLGTINPSPSPLAACALFGTCPPTGGTAEPAPNTSAPAPGTVALPGRVADAGAATGRLTVNDDGGSDGGAVSSIDARITGGIAASSTSTDLLFAGAPANTTSADARAQGAPTSTYSTHDGSAVGVPTSEPMTTALWSSGTLIAANTGALTGPGTTNFVPNNVIGTAGLQNSTRWFEVNLRAAGTTFLTGTTVTIDRLNLRGASAGLNIRSGARLNTAISSFVDAGLLTVDGIFNPTRLDVLGGTVTGNGSIETTQGVLVAGGILTPGAVNAVGTLATTGGTGFGGSGVFAVDVAGPTLADRLNVTGNLVLGGGFVANFLNNYVPEWGAAWTVASATGTVTGTFSMVAANTPGVLRPRVRTVGQTVVLDIIAAPFASFANCTTQQCSAFAATLDGARASNYNALGSVYRYADRLSPSAAADFLNQLAPWDAQIGGRALTTATDAMSTQIFQRIIAVRQGGSTGADLGRIQLASTSTGDVTMTDAMPAAGGGASLREGWSLFGEVRAISGESAASGGFAGSELDSYAAMLGVDWTNGNKIIGAALQANWGDAALNNNLASADTNLVLLTVYGSVSGNGVSLDGHVSYGDSSIDSVRQAGPFAMTGNSGGTVFGWGAALSYDHPVAFGGIVPRASVTYSSVDLAAYTETGTAALSYGAREVTSFVGRLGVSVYGEAGPDGRLKPWIGVNAVRDFGSTGDAFGSFGFAAAAPATVSFMSAPATDAAWGEAQIGVEAEMTGNSVFGVSYETTFGNENVEIQQIRARVRVAF